MLEKGINAHLLSAEAFEGKDPYVIVARLNDWLHKQPSSIVINDIIPVSQGVLVIYMTTPPMMTG